MGLNLFLLLPQTDGGLLEIIQTKDDYKQFVKEISDIVSILSDHSVKLFYDSENIKTFIGTCEQFENEIYLANAANQIRSFISPKSVDIYTNLSKDKECIYVLWNLNKLLLVEYAPDIIAEIAEKMLSSPNEKFLLLNISENIKADRNVLLVCKDAKHIPELPIFIRIMYVIDKSELALWLATNHIHDFSLFDKNRFTKTNFIEQGQRVFQENKTKYYWYLDNLHKNHYEVFDNTGKHFGESDLNGQIDNSKKKPAKTINI
jgi:hypothetical protein